MNQTIIGGKNSEHNRQLHEAREARLTKVHEAFLNSKYGMSVKELAIDFGISSNLARDYVNTLLERNVIRFDHKDGKAPIYAIVNVVADEVQSEPTAEETKDENKAPETLEVKPYGKEFAPGSYIPCSNVCKPGDVVWISSRSGEGQFFRYLIITPWERKAMVLGVMLEGHPQLNLNDPYYVYIGVDPETQLSMYADIRNNCQLLQSGRPIAESAEMSLWLEYDQRPVDRAVAVSGRVRGSRHGVLLDLLEPERHRRAGNLQHHHEAEEVHRL